MGFYAHRERLTGNEEMFVATEKLWISADGNSLVPDGHPSARSLFCVPGKAISMGEAKKWGLVPSEPAPALKERRPQETKQLQPEETKKKKKAKAVPAPKPKPKAKPKPKPKAKPKAAPAKPKPKVKARKLAIPLGRGKCPFCKQTFEQVKKHAQRMHGV
jgi:outer membrane biosynthesis protein TonB